MVPRVVVIGAGFGGIAAALRARAKGYEVTLIDRCDHLGGRAQVFERKGFRHDAGPTVITAPFLFDELFTLFHQKMSDHVRLVPLNPWYRFRFPDGTYFNYGGSVESTLDEIARFCPEDRQGYLDLVEESKKIFAVGFEQLADKPFDRFWTMLSLLPQLVSLGSYRTVWQQVARHIWHPWLRRALSVSPLLVGGNPFDTTSIYSLIHYLERKWGILFVMGGTGAMVQALGRLLTSSGVEVRLNQTVTEIEISRGAATGVRLESGEKVAADLVISDADPAFVYAHMLRKVPIVPRLKLRAASYSMGLFVLYFGTTRKFNDVAHHTIWFGDRYCELLRDIFHNHSLSNDFSLYVHRPTATDTSFAPEGCDSFYVLAPVPNLQAKIDWDQVAESYGDSIVKALDETMMPGLRECITGRFQMTPRDFEQRYLSVHGAGFSVAPIFRQSAWFRFHNRAEGIRNLFLVGAGTHPGAGLPGVLSSAKVVERYLPDLQPQPNPATMTGLHAEPARVMAASGKTFYRAARLLPRSTRDLVIELYGFCRRIDDVADESVEPEGIRCEHLLQVERSLEGVAGPEFAHACGWSARLDRALGDSRIAAIWLVRAAGKDVARQQPLRESHLIGYAFGVAGTVGLMMCHLLKAAAGGRDAAVSLGIAMQLSNIARDVEQDWRASRIYLPASWITAEKVAAALQQHDESARYQLVEATKQLLLLADRYYECAYDGIWALPWRVRWSILAAALCYREIGIAVGRDIPRSWQQRTVVGTPRKLWLIALAGFRLLLPRYWRRPRRIATPSSLMDLVPSSLAAR